MIPSTRCEKCSSRVLVVMIPDNELVQHATWHEYVQLVEAVGHGFHPDTPGNEYLSLPPGYTPADVDWIVEMATRQGIDLYAEAINILEGVYK